MKIFVLGYPGDMGGANTECWHTVRALRRMGLDVTLIPTWGRDDKWKAKLDAIGCETLNISLNDLEKVDGLSYSPVIGICNSEYLAVAARLRAMQCRLIWMNCMTFMFPAEKTFIEKHGKFDIALFQSKFQRASLGEIGKQNFTIHAAYEHDDLPYAPRPHIAGSEYYVGRVARPDQDKWSSNLLYIYGRINYEPKRGILLGVDDKTRAKIGTPPWWVDTIKPMGVPVKEFYSRLHCVLTVNGGAKENWPRIGLESFSAGVPVVAQNDWGWKEMVVHGETGFLGSTDEELAHYAGAMAYDETLRLSITERARERLVDELANPKLVEADWWKILNSLQSS